jgi:hypothetical protein
LFYVDDNNTIRDVKSPSWQNGDLSSLGIRCAHYSKLSATTISQNNFQAICLFYQSPDKDAGILMASLSTKNNRWVHGVPDMSPTPVSLPPPPRMDEHVLYGTSLSALPSRQGFQVQTNSTVPVVYLQTKSLSLTQSQAEGTFPQMGLVFHV